MELADRYEQWLEQVRRAEAECSARVAEGGLQLPRPVPDAELQARWFAGELGWRFTTTAGAEVEIRDFGRWNPQPGAVFTGAKVIFNGGTIREGGIDLRCDPAAWGNVAEPEYDDTVLHLFAGAGVGGWGRPRLTSLTHSGREVPQVALDITALEFASPAPAHCGDAAPALAAFSGDQITQLLEAGAQYRLLLKDARIARLSAQTSPSEGLYQSIAETLGYRHNKLPFTLLAQRFPVALLRQSIADIEPMLFAASSFLTAELNGLPGDSQGYLREVWNRWWPRRTEYERLILPHDLWVLHGARPVNHPQRRVAALAETARNWPVIENLIRMADRRAIRAFFADLKHGYWDYHYTLTSSRSSRRMALVGELRVHEMLANVVYPLAVGRRDSEAKRHWRAYLALPAYAENEKLQQAATLFFSAEQQPMVRQWMKRLAYQQGLLQLFENATPGCANPDCGRCVPTERLRLWSTPTSWGSG